MTEKEKLEGWPEDLKLGLEHEIKELDRELKEARQQARLARTLEEKVAAPKRILALDAERCRKRRSLFEAQDAIDHRRDELIAGIEGQLEQRTSRSSTRPGFAGSS